MHWIEMLRAQVSPGEERRLIQSLQELFQASDKLKPPVVAATLWRHATLASDLCVFIHCIDSSKGRSPTQSLLGQQVADMMRASGLISIDVWHTPGDESMEVQQ